MSSILCSNLHTAVCALAAVNLGVTNNSPRTVYVAFRGLNNAALADRYGATPIPAGNSQHYLKKAEEYLAHHRDPEFVSSLLSCLHYQCIEGDAMNTHKAGPLLSEALDKALAASDGRTRPGVWDI